MIATIVFGIAIIFGIILIVWVEKEGYEDNTILVGLAMVFVSGGLLALSLCIGYLPAHSISREEVVQALGTTPNSATIRMAEQWNDDEKRGNNYWCRFSLREENPIDINQILIDYKGGE